MKACVVFDTRYGNTLKIAKSLESGLKGAGIDAFCLNAKDVTSESIRESDLMCVGAPTEWHTAYRPIREFLRGLHRQDVAGKFGFAFDTKLERPLAGSAAKPIEEELRSLGFRIIAPRESATVFLEGGNVGGAKLKEGEEKRFEGIGLRIGGVLLRRRKEEVKS
jgi:flavodoxin